ncbi:unnamed protein product [Cuscuta campestris]|uniref:Aminotransferase class V domain-containing protein n=1 Tax=Cuscuta campestris TaxID=132261 RepID=A0A484JZJ1_9ASTE|nr:unnamed protein product [Cuscuta campestris]
MAMSSEKEVFLKEFGEDYGYRNSSRNIDQIRAMEFKRLEGVVYLDHAGATLHSESQLEAVLKELNSTVYGNPHSQSSCSMSSNDCVQKARQQVLEFFNASPREYSCIFTSGATAALKLVGETFPWCSESSFMYTMENHNSVLGIREYLCFYQQHAMNSIISHIWPYISAFSSCAFSLSKAKTLA